MSKLMIDIEIGSNGGYVVTWYKTMPTGLQKLAGIKQEKELLAFQNINDLAKWIEKQGGNNMDNFKKKELKITQMPTESETQDTQIKTKETPLSPKQEEISIEEVSLQLTEHQFKAYVITSLEEIKEKLK